MFEQERGNLRNVKTAVLFWTPVVRPHFVKTEYSCRAYSNTVPFLRDP